MTARTEVPCPWSGMNGVTVMVGLTSAAPAPSVTLIDQVFVPWVGGPGSLDTSVTLTAPLVDAFVMFAVYVSMRGSLWQETTSPSLTAPASLGAALGVLHAVAKTTANGASEANGRGEERGRGMRIQGRYARVAAWFRTWRRICDELDSRPFMRLRFASVILVVAAPASASCGSRTALEVEATAAPMDAGIDALAARACTIGDKPVALASHLAGPRGLALGKNHLFVAVSSDTPSMRPRSGVVIRIPKRGGAAEILAHDLDGPRDVAVDDSAVYWLNDGEGAVRRVGFDFGTMRVLATGFVGARGIALDATSVFWGNARGGNVMKVAKVEVENRAVAIAQATDTPAIAVDDARVYYAHATQKTIESVTKAGGSPKIDVLATDTVGVAIDESNLYFSSSERQTQVLALPFAGGAPLRIAFASGAVGSIVIDRDYVYWTEGIAGAYSIRRAAKRGSGVEILATETSIPGAIAVDDDCVYWEQTSPDASIMKVAKQLR